MTDIADIFASGDEKTLTELENLGFPMKYGLAGISQHLIGEDGFTYIYSLVSRREQTYKPFFKYNRSEIKKSYKKQD